MLVLLVLLAACLGSPVFAYKSGAPSDVCSNGLTPVHGVEGQTTPAPYEFDAPSVVKADDERNLITLKAKNGESMLGFVIQARDGDQKPVGVFEVADAEHSQLLRCDHANDTLTHKTINKENPLRKLPLYWKPPHNYKGPVNLVATVAKNGGVFWVQGVRANITVQ